MEHDGRAVSFVIVRTWGNHGASFRVIGSKERKFACDEREHIVFVFMSASGLGNRQGDDEIIVIPRFGIGDACLEGPGVGLVFMLIVLS